MDWVDITRTAVGLTALGIIAYAWAVEPCLVRITRRTIEIPCLPDPLNGFTICHLSDLHIAQWGRIERALQRVLSRVEADICVITGDIVAQADGVRALARLLDGFRPQYGIVGVLGNGEHDPWMPGAMIAGDLEKAGVRVLVNEATSVRIGGSDIHLIGVDDPFTGHDDLEKAMAGVGDGLRVLLAHSPDIVGKLGDRRVDLILAGHTHGGQIRAPFVGALWTHSRYPLPRPSGYYSPETLAQIAGHDVGTARMYVGRGISGSGIRARFLCPPEVALLTLRSARPSSERPV